MSKELAKVEPVKLARVTEKNTLPAVQKLGDAELERRFNRLCKGNSEEFWAVKTERSRRLAEAAQERELSAAKKRAEIARHSKEAEMDNLTIRAIRPQSAHEINN